MPFSIRILLESGVRNCDGFQVTKEDVEKMYNWELHQKNDETIEVSFKPSRVILQDFTGVPALVDFAAMRDAVNELGGNPMTINPICPADLVIDHSVQVDFVRRYVQLFLKLFCNSSLHHTMERCKPVLHSEFLVC